MNSVIIDKFISSGSPIVRGRRLTVYNVVTKIYYEESLSNALEDYEITYEEALDSVKYCEALQCQTEKNLVKFCSGCLLRTLQDGWSFDRKDFMSISIRYENSKISVSRDNRRIFLGTLQELEDAEFGKAGWLMALDVHRYFDVG